MPTYASGIRIKCFSMPSWREWISHSACYGRLLLLITVAFEVKHAIKYCIGWLWTKVIRLGGTEIHLWLVVNVPSRKPFTIRPPVLQGTTVANAKIARSAVSAGWCFCAGNNVSCGDGVRCCGIGTLYGSYIFVCFFLMHACCRLIIWLIVYCCINCINICIYVHIGHCGYIC